MMTLDTCNVSVQMDVTAAKASFKALTLDDFPGENVTALTTLLLKYIKVMSGNYSMNVELGSHLIKKVCSTSSDYFNCCMHLLLDEVKPFEEKYC